MMHRLAHLFGIFYGEVYSWHEKGKLMVGFRCTKCGNIYGVHDATHVIDDVYKKFNTTSPSG